MANNNADYKIIATIIIVVLLLILGFLWYARSNRETGTTTQNNSGTQTVTNFDECVNAGNAVRETNPRQCVDASGKTYFEEPQGNNGGESSTTTGTSTDTNTSTSTDTNTSTSTSEGNATTTSRADIILDNPKPEQSVNSPLVINGRAKGNWFFEASFPVVLTNWDGVIIAQGTAQAKGDWMTDDFVPFEAKLEYKNDNSVSNRGALILRKDNPSGLPQNDAAYEITVFFK